MLSGFRKKFVVTRQLPGAYANGTWQAGSASQIDVMASVQPVSGRDLEALPEGNRSSSVVKIYTSMRLMTVDTAAGQPADTLNFMGEEYEIVSESANQSGVISHFKYLAALNAE